MEIVCQRFEYSPKSTISEITITKKYWQRYVLEDVTRPPGVKVKHHTAIPAGRYQVVLSYSERFNKIMPLLLNVPGFEGIRIHTGNTDKDTSGCLLLGTQYKSNWVGGSGVAYMELLKYIQMEQFNGKIWITIIDDSLRMQQHLSA